MCPKLTTVHLSGIWLPLLSKGLRTMSLDMTALSGSKPALWQIQWALLIPHAEELVSLSLVNAFELDNSEDRGSGFSGESAML